MRLQGGWHAPPPLLGGAVAALGLVLLSRTTAALAASSGVAHAAEPTMPPPEMLEQLKQRLLEPPRCAPDCGAINRLALDATRGELRLALEASAAARTAIPLPGNLKDWVPGRCASTESRRPRCPAPTTARCGWRCRRATFRRRDDRPAVAARDNRRSRCRSSRGS